MMFTQSAPFGLPPQSEHHFAANTRHQWPFEFVVPLGSPPTQHHDFGEATATIRYDIKATAYTTGLFSSNLKAATSLVVLPSFPAMPPEGAAGMAPVEHSGRLQVADICCCTCFGYTELRAIVRAPKTSLCVGEVLPLNIEILNGLTDLSVDQITVSLGAHFVLTVRGGPGSARRGITLWTKSEAVNAPPNPALANVANMRAGLGVQVATSVQSGSMVPDVNTAAFTSRNVVVILLRLRNSRKVCRVELPLGTPYLNMMPGAPQMQMPMPMQMPMKAPFAQQPPPMQQQMQMVPLQQPQQMQPQLQQYPPAQTTQQPVYPPPQGQQQQQPPAYGYAQQTPQQPVWQPPVGMAAAPAAQSMQQTKEAAAAEGTSGPPGGYNPPPWQPAQQSPAYAPQQHPPQPGDRYQPGGPPAYDPSPAYASAAYNSAYAPGGPSAPAYASTSHAEGAPPPATA